MICPRCGAENESKINFCKACGNPIASNIVEPIDFGKTQAVPVVVNIKFNLATSSFFFNA